MKKVMDPDPAGQNSTDQTGSGSSFLRKIHFLMLCFPQGYIICYTGNQIFLHIISNADFLLDYPILQTYFKLIKSLYDIYH